MNIIRPVSVRCRVKERRWQKLTFDEQQRDKKATHVSIAVKKRMNGLELRVSEPGMNQRM